MRARVVLRPPHPWVCCCCLKEDENGRRAAKGEVDDAGLEGKGEGRPAANRGRAIDEGRHLSDLARRGEGAMEAMIAIKEGDLSTERWAVRTARRAQGDRRNERSREESDSSCLQTSTSTFFPPY